MECWRHCQLCTGWSAPVARACCVGCGVITFRFEGGHVRSSGPLRILRVCVVWCSCGRLRTV